MAMTETATRVPDPPLPHATTVHRFRRVGPSEWSWRSLVARSQCHLPNAKITPAQQPPAPPSLAVLSATEHKSFRADKVVLSDTKHRALWLAVLALQLSNAALLLASAYMYLTHDNHESYLWFVHNYFLFSDASLFLQKHSLWVGRTCLLLSAVFVYWSVEMAWCSLRARVFHFVWPRAERVRAQTAQGGIVHFEASGQHSRVQRALSAVCASVVCISTMVVPRKCRAWCTACCSAMVRLKQHIGIEGEYFDIRLVTENTFEVACQSYTAFRCSERISNAFVGPTYGVLIFCNCANGLFFRRWFGRDIVMRRLACVLSDLLIVFVWGSILPLWLLLPSFRIYSDSALLEAAKDNSENTTRELELILIVSLPNLVTILTPFVSSMLNLAELKTVLAVADHARIVSSRQSSGHTPAAAATPAAVPSRSLKHTSAPSQHDATATRRAQPAKHRPCASLLTAWYALSAGYGAVMLSASIYSSAIYREPPSGSGAIECVHEVYPWFSTKHACIGRTVNCRELGITGKKRELEVLLDTFEESSLANLQLSHCWRLEIPASVVESFASLLTLVLRNSTLTEWSDDAALDEGSTLQSVRILDVVIESVPTGLVSKPLSPTLEWIDLHNVNAAIVLDAVHDQWQHLQFFDCDGCGLTAVPKVVQSMHKLITLSLRDNEIAHISDDALSTSAATNLFGIFLDGNPLRDLPASIWDLTAQSNDMSLQRTDIAANVDVLNVLAARAGPSVAIYAFDTPLCQSHEAMRAIPQLKCEPKTF